MPRQWIRWTLPLFFSSFTLAAAPSSQPTTSPALAFPTVEEVNQSFADKNYQQTIQLSSKLIALKGAAAANIDQIELLKLKFESQIQLKQNSAAIDTMKTLQKTSKDKKQQDIAAATIFLFGHSIAGVYKPQHPPTAGAKLTAIDIIDPTSRTSAFEALFNDQRALIEPKMKSAIASRSIPPLFTALKELANLRPLDVAASDSSSRTTQMEQQVVDSAKALMLSATQNLTGEIDRIEAMANTDVPTTQTYIDPLTHQTQQIVTHRKQGLSRKNVQDLRDIVTTAGKVSSSANDLAKFDDLPSDTTDIQTECEHVARKANDVRLTDYNVDNPAARQTHGGR